MMKHHNKFSAHAKHRQRTRSPYSNNNMMVRSQNNHHSSMHHQYENMHISKESLASRLAIGRLPTIVIDTRDDDTSRSTASSSAQQPQQGSSSSSSTAMIQGALYCPEYFFRESEVDLIIKKAKMIRNQCNTGISNPKCVVVFYCNQQEAEDEFRRSSSTKCAMRLRRAIRDLGEMEHISVRVLKGGMDAWMSSYGHDHRLVEGGDLVSNCWSISANGQQEQASPVVVPRPVQLQGQQQQQQLAC